jgi:hypothetical protein
MAARDEYPELKRLDVAFAELRAEAPVPPALSDLSVYRVKYQAWKARFDALRSELDSVMAEIGANLYTRCSGTGLTTHSRHNGMCYLCQGDGWSARGRRQKRAA